ncbi:hypothetical protein IID24_05620 [Patescibacteria group bacterium]|nr:hypothetical protein [Patescibacteria group bacterium]
MENFKETKQEENLSPQPSPTPQPTPSLAPQPSSKKNYLLIGVIVAIVVVIVGAGILVFLSKKETRPQTPEAKETEALPVNPTTDWQTYRNEELGFVIDYPRDWGYTILESPNSPIVFAPKGIIADIERSLEGIRDKSLTIMFTLYDKELYEKGILPYREEPNEFIHTTSVVVDVGETKAIYYVSERLQERFGYKVGEKTVTVDLELDNGYLSIHLFDEQHLNVLSQILSTFRFIEQE